MIRRCRFIGKPDETFPMLETGKIYKLTIAEYSRGPLGWVIGNFYPVIIKPFQCPYRSWETFDRNWIIL